MDSSNFYEVKKSLMDSFNSSSGFFQKFLNECPEDVWQEVFGKWPIWQQGVHLVSTHNWFFSDDKDYLISAPYPSDVANFTVVGDTPVSIDEIKKSCSEMIEKTRLFIENADEKLLFSQSEVLSNALSTPTSVLGMLSLVSSHMMYHLGMCDASLRCKGLPGIF